ncbi:hypothetical protein OF375_00085 [Ureaplasma miroungigenitalium]|nr:hypothetical protein [Ureaplasma miroungigenitalium]
MVMQASPLLYEPGDLSDALMVLIWGNIDYDELETIRDLLADMRDGEVEVPEQLSEIVESLNDPLAMVEGSFNPHEIDDSFTNTAVRLETIYWTKRITKSNDT